MVTVDVVFSWPTLTPEKATATRRPRVMRNAVFMAAQLKKVKWKRDAFPRWPALLRRVGDFSRQPTYTILLFPGHRDRVRNAWSASEPVRRSCAFARDA